MSPQSSSASIPPAEYCRRARRLRHIFAGNPHGLHRHLRNLASTPPRHPQPQSPPPLMIREARWEAFAQCVAQRLDGPVLRYSNRLALLHEAQQMGIGRFEANLIIATVQHRMHHATPQAQPHPSRFPRTLAVAIAIQSIILLTLYIVFLR